MRIHIGYKTIPIFVFCYLLQSFNSFAFSPSRQDDQDQEHSWKIGGIHKHVGGKTANGYHV